MMIPCPVCHRRRRHIFLHAFWTCCTCRNQTCREAPRYGQSSIEQHTPRDPK